MAFTYAAVGIKCDYSIIALHLAACDVVFVIKRSDKYNRTGGFGKH